MGRRISFFSNIFLGVDMLYGAVHKRGRCLHDIVAGTIVTVTDRSRVE